MGFLFGGATPSGKIVSEQTAMSLSVVHACVKIISETVASLPLHTYKTTPEGREKGPDGRPKARNISVADITDGTAFTLAVVEKRDSFGWAVGGWGGSEFDVYTTPAYEGDDKVARKVYSGSTHAIGPNALFCDASVRTLPARQDKKIWYRLITRAGGEAVRFADEPLGQDERRPAGAPPAISKK